MQTAILIIGLGWRLLFLREELFQLSTTMKAVVADAYFGNYC